MQQSHPAVYVIADGGGHDSAVESYNRTDRYAETDVNVGGRTDSPRRRQRRGVTKLADRIRFELDSSRCENSRVCHHRVAAFDPQAKRIDANEF